MTEWKVKILLATTLAALLVEPLRTVGSQSGYPEERSDLQKYQDVSRCYPDIGEWILMYRNYYTDPVFGGNAKCIKYQRYGTYENFSTPMAFTFGKNGSTSGKLALNSSPCYTGKDITKFTPDDGYGCSLWRRAGTLQEPNDCCEFIYDENCGSSPKYQIYDPKTCNF